MKPEYIIVHHSLTKDSNTVSWGAIRKYHLSKGWSDIGYHAGIEFIQENIEVLLGRRWDKVGAHCSQDGMNKKSLGLCLIGNFDITVPDILVLDVATDLIRYWMRLFQIPAENVLPHRQFATYKTCPGRKFDFDFFQQRL